MIRDKEKASHFFFVELDEILITMNGEDASYLFEVKKDKLLDLLKTAFENKTHGITANIDRSGYAYVP